jgi:hypothetical protein
MDPQHCAKKLKIESNNSFALVSVETNKLTYMETSPSLQSFTKYTVPVRYHFRQLYEIKWGELNKKLMITADIGVLPKRI